MAIVGYSTCAAKTAAFSHFAEGVLLYLPVEDTRQWAIARFESEHNFSA